MLRRSLRQLLLVDAFRYGVALVRYVYFRGLRGRLRTHESSDPAVAKNTIGHNLRLMLDLSVRRSLTLIRPLSTIDRISSDIDKVRVLSIGPRTEGELLNLVGHGFRAKNIRGLDLISYSPWIDLGDMHAMPYPDDSWDAVVLGWVLAYSNDRSKAAQEVVRVARNGAVIAAGVEYHPESEESLIAQHGYRAGADTRVTSVAEILGFFGSHVDQVYLSHDVDPKRLDRVGAIYTLFSIKK